MLRDSYQIKKIFGPTIQGEGSLAGTVCHFVRFAGCNMWDGRPHTRAGSQCPYCDTDFWGGEKMTAEAIVWALKQLGPVRWVTLSGGEPLLQFDWELSGQLTRAGYHLAVETNGTRPCEIADHVTCSPKVRREEMELQWCHDLKFLYPHPFLKPEDFLTFPAKQRWLQPVMDEHYEQNLRATIKKLYELEGRWKLSLQTHKIINVE